MCQVIAKQVKREPGSEEPQVKIEPGSEGGAIVPVPELTEEQIGSDVQMDKHQLIRMGYHGPALVLCKGLEGMCRIFHAVIFVLRW